MKQFIIIGVISAAIFIGYVHLMKLRIRRAIENGINEGFSSLSSSKGWTIKPPPTAEELSCFRFVVSQDGRIKVETTISGHTTNWTPLGNVWTDTNSARFDIEWQISHNRNAKIESERIYKPLK